MAPPRKTHVSLKKNRDSPSLSKPIVSSGQNGSAWDQVPWQFLKGPYNIIILILGPRTSNFNVLVLANCNLV